MSNREIVVNLQPGQVVDKPANGEFWFVKTAVRDFKLRVDQQTQTVTEGDFARYPKRFGAIQFENIDTERPLRVVLVVGFGEYDRKIIRGTITAKKGVERANGEIVPDTRYSIDAYVIPTNTQTVTYAVGDVIDSTNEGVTGGIGSHRAVTLRGGNVLIADNTYFVREYDKDFNFIGSYDLDLSVGGVASGALIDWAYDEKRGRFVALTNTSVIEGGGWTGKAVMVFSESFTVKSGVRAPDSYELTGITYDKKYDRFISLELRDNGASFALVVRDAETLTEQSVYMLPHIGLTGITMYGGEVWLINNANSAVKVHDLDTFGALDDKSIGQGNGIVASWDDLAAFFVSSSGVVLRKVAAEDILFNGKGYISVDAGKIIMRDSHYTRADVTYSGEVGSFKVTGEMIKAALEWSMGKFIADGYLDNVYAIEFSSPEIGKPYRVASGDQSFLAAGIEDSFSVTLPQKITIVTDRELPIR